MFALYFASRFYLLAIDLEISQESVAYEADFEISRKCITEAVTGLQ